LSPVLLSGCDYGRQCFGPNVVLRLDDRETDWSDVTSEANLLVENRSVWPIMGT
jgi:hypothetical protein